MLAAADVYTLCHAVSTLERVRADMALPRNIATINTDVPPEMSDNSSGHQPAGRTPTLKQSQSPSEMELGEMPTLSKFLRETSGQL